MRILPADYIIMAVYLVIVISLGVYVSNQGESAVHMLLADRQIGLYSLAASFIATEWGTISLVFQAGAGGLNPLRQLYAAWALLAAFLIAGFWGIPTITPRRKKLMTAGEIIGERFGKTARIIFGVFMSGVYILLLGALLSAFSRMFAVFLGTSPAFMMLLMVLVAVVYTVSGGMWSVVLTSYIHVFVIGVMIPVSALFSMKAAGGFDALFTELAEIEAKAAPAAATLASDTGPAAIFIKFLLFLCAALCFPTIYARACSARSVGASYKGFLLGAISMLGCAVFSSVIAASAAAVSPKAAGAAAFAKTIVASTPKGLTGLMCAASMGIFMSGCSAYYLAVGRMLSKDVAEQLLPENKKPGDADSIKFLRVGVILSALISFIIGYRSDNLTAVLTFFLTAAASGGAACTLAGVYWKKATKAGAAGSFLAGGTFYAAARFYFHRGYNVAAFGAVIFSFAAMAALSLIFANKTERAV
ncbi:MAG: hypothetical protein Q8878_02270 [Bacillota bacterium]|nr:hypothetical protein [Bacillota bacterium]